jgi:hypothetical protein
MAPPPFIQNLMALGTGTEVLYSFVIIVCSLMVYYGTRELYELSSYKGIKYFREAFLFFAIAYFFRSFIKLGLMYLDLDNVFSFSPRIFAPLTMFIFIYFSSMAIFYLLYSVMWKKWNGSSKKIYLFHLLALIISFIVILTNNRFIQLAVNLFLLLFVLFIVYISYKDSKDKKKGYNLYVIYVLLSIFWILNIIDIIIPKFLETINLIIYLASTGIFLLILYRVIKKTGSN